MASSRLRHKSTMSSAYRTNSKPSPAISPPNGSPVDIGQKRAKDSALRSAFPFCFLPVRPFDHSLFQQPPDQPQNPPVGNVLAHQNHEPVMGNRVEVALDVHVNDVRVSCTKRFLHAPQRIITTASGAESQAVSGKTVLKDWLNDHSHRHAPVPRCPVFQSTPV
jgi:hypothetical protein